MNAHGTPVDCETCGRDDLIAIGATDEARDRAAAEGCGCPTNPSGATEVGELTAAPGVTTRIRTTLAAALFYCGVPVAWLLYLAALATRT